MASQNSMKLQRAFAMRSWLGPWPQFVFRRLGGLLAVIMVLLIATFLLVHLTPGDPARAVAGREASAQDVARVRQALGLTEPLVVQFYNYCLGVAHFNLGTSFVTGEPVSQILAERLPKTAELAGVSFLLILIFGLSIGIASAVQTREGRHRRVEFLFTAGTSAAGAIPSYLAGTILAAMFAVWLGWLPVAGSDYWYSIVLPAAALSVGPTAVMSRIVRVATLNVLSQDYIRVARSKRLPIRLLYLRHILPNVLTASLTVGGIIFAFLLGGAVVVENVFAWPGLGTVLVSSVLQHDYPVVQGISLFLGFAVVVVNATVDLTLAIVDRRSVIGSS